MPEAVVFDLDGVLLDSEQIWNEVREQLVLERGGRWHERATVEMMGMSSTEWSRYLHDRLGVDLLPEQINDEVVARVRARYEVRLPLLPHAVETVGALAPRWPLALASSANRPVIELVLDRSGLRACFAVVLSSEEVPHGKPAPDVYLEAARRLHADAARCVAVEDSTNGVRAAVAAGMATVAVPNRHFPPAADALADAALVIHSLGELTPEAVERLC